MTEPTPPRAATPSRAPWAALSAAACAGMALLCGPLVKSQEDGSHGAALRPYQDIVGVWTQCDGETVGVTAKSPTETPAACQLKLDRRLAGTAQAVLACVPGLRGRDALWASQTSLAYNIGPPTYCRSTAARELNAGHLRAGCDAMLLFDKAGGRVVAGLARRRQAERALCLRGVD